MNCPLTLIDLYLGTFQNVQCALTHFNFITDGSPIKKKNRKDIPNSKLSLGVLPLTSVPPLTTPAAPPGTESDGHSSDGDRKRKKARTTFTGRQIFELERQFEVKKYLSSSERADMAKLLGVTETQVSETGSCVVKEIATVA